MSRSGPVILGAALGAGYLGFGNVVRALGGPAPAMLSVFVAAFLISLIGKARPRRRPWSGLTARPSDQRAGTTAPAHQDLVAAELIQLEGS